MATFISLRLLPSAFSRETILRDSEIRHTSIGRTIVPMGMITQLIETGWIAVFNQKACAKTRDTFSAATHSLQL